VPHLGSAILGIVLKRPGNNDQIHDGQMFGNSSAGADYDQRANIPVIDRILAGARCSRFVLLLWRRRIPVRISPPEEFSVRELADGIYRHCSRASRPSTRCLNRFERRTA